VNKLVAPITGIGKARRSASTTRDSLYTHRPKVERLADLADHGIRTLALDVTG